MKSSRHKMARVALWAVLVFLVALFVSYFLDSNIPEDIPETWKVRFMDAAMRTYKCLIQFLTRVKLTDYFSPFDRKLSDWFVLFQMTGQPWGMALTVDQKLKINDTVIAGVRVVIYEPVSTFHSNERPALVFLHGGGWSTLSVDSYDPLVRKIARDSGVVIISVNYRQSPEYPYPVPLDDCLSVVNHVISNPANFRVDPNRIAVGGDSCGGNMAASIALRLRDKLAMQILVVPALQFLNFRTTAFIENTPYFHDSINSKDSLVFVTNYLGVSPNYYKYFLVNNHTTRSLKLSHMAARIDQRTWMRRDLVRNKHLLDKSAADLGIGYDYLADMIEEHITDPYFAPLMADDVMLRHTSEAYIVTCGYDFIRDDGVMYAERLKSVHNRVTHKHYPTGFHNALFFPHGPLRLQVGESIVSDLVKHLASRL